MEVSQILRLTGGAASPPPSYPSYASYLCQEVFTDMSVLPLVFPSNISCFSPSHGSYQEELARKRELPVPPLPRRGSVLAASDDNIARTVRSPLPCSPLARPSSLSWLGEAEPDTMLHTRITAGGAGRAEGGRSQEEPGTAHPTQPEPVSGVPAGPPKLHSVCRAGGEREDVVSKAADSKAADSQAAGRQATDSKAADSEAEQQQTADNTPEPNNNNNNNNKENFSKMSAFKKREKVSLFQRTIDRLSFKSRRKREKALTETAEKEEKNEKENRADCGVIIPEIDEEPKRMREHVMEADSAKPEPASNPPPAPPPASARYTQSRPLNSLDAALKSFKQDAARSRENLSLSRPDLGLTPRARPGQARPALARPAGAGPPSSAKWRQVAPAPNRYLDSEWAKLSASMVNLSSSRTSLAQPGSGLAWRETSLASSQASLNTKPGLEQVPSSGLGSSQASLDTVSLAPDQVEPVRETRPGLDRASSCSVLLGADTPVKVPDSQLAGLNSYQRRVMVSMERLSVPGWYRPAPPSQPATPATPHRGQHSSGATPDSTDAVPAWRKGGSLQPGWRSASLSAGWRRGPAGCSSHYSSTRSTPPTSPASASSTLERAGTGTLLASARYRSRGSTLPPGATLSPPSSSVTRPSLTRPYLGWRSQERLDIGPAYLASPAQRLASSAVHTTQVKAVSPVSKEEVEENIREVADAILDYCASPVEGKPAAVKQAWLSGGEESDGASDNPDDDSGIDRSDDFTQEILAEG